jgi:type I restriction enzyme S subunit
MTIDTSNWGKVTLGDIARSLTIATKDPLLEGFERYVGLEHIEPGNIHIKSWGNVADGTTFTRVFRKGQVLFGKRRAYQKKAAMAEFDGVCSGDILVCEAIKGTVLPELLPFIVQSDRFFECAIKTSAGSLSPRTKFKDLAKFTFKLPVKPVDQKRIANFLWSIDDSTEKKKCLLGELQQLFKAVVEENITNAKGAKILLREIATKTVNGFVDGDWIESKDQSENGIRLLQLADIGVREFLDKSHRFISEDTFSRLNCFEVLPGDILLARMPDPIGRACIVPDIGCKMITAVDCCVIRVDEKQHNKLYWVYFLNSDFMRRKIESLASGTTRSRISRKNLEAIQVYCPVKEDQDKIINRMNGLMGNMDAVAESISLQYQIQKQIINQIFG